MRNYFLFLILFFCFPSTTFAQKQEPIREDWLAEDINSTKLIPKLFPPENHNEESIAKILGDKYSFFNQKDFGFGSKTFGSSKPNGYTHLSVSAFIFNGSYIFYRIEIRGMTGSWERINQRIIDAWKQNAGIPFEEGENNIFFEKKNDAVLQEYKDAVGKELGTQLAIDIPLDLKNEYDYLVSPMNNSVVGNNGCDVAGVIPIGKEAIDVLVRAKRVDLIENVLRGFNPGGRVYAAIALLEMEKEGFKLKPETKRTLEKIINLNIKIETCSGCIHRNVITRELLKEYKLL